MTKQMTVYDVYRIRHFSARPAREPAPEHCFWQCECGGTWEVWVNEYGNPIIGAPVAAEENCPMTRGDSAAEQRCREAAEMGFDIV